LPFDRRQINRFAERNRHQIFVEPEGRNTVEIYVNGFSTSLPLPIQERAIRQIPGFVTRVASTGYAIEYDYFPQRNLKPTLETEGCSRALLRRSNKWHHRILKKPLLAKV
jgi:tRNA uridine 5-carboxymethylaminomethyl modification enzyme